MESKRTPAFDLVEAVIVAVIIAIGIRFFLVESFVIPSASMEPTLVPGDRVMVNKLTYRLNDPKPGDIVVFRYPLDTRSIYIKRLIAVGGQTVEVRQGRLYIDGQRTPEENYVMPDTVMDDFGPAQVPPDTFFVMGDNRNNSQDSRSWGTVPRQNFLGKAFLLYWPVGRLQVIN